MHSNRTYSKNLLLGFFLFLGACGASTGVSPDGKNPDFNPNDKKPNDKRGQGCDIVFDKKTMKDNGVSLPLAYGDFVVPSPVGVIQTCDSSMEINGVRTSVHYDGYSNITAYKKLDFKGTFRSDPDNKKVVKINYLKPVLVDSSEKKELAMSLHGLMSNYLESTVQVLPAFSSNGQAWVLYSDGTVGYAYEFALGEEGEALLSFDVPAGQSSENFAAKLNDGSLTFSIVAEVRGGFFDASVLIESPISVQGRVFSSQIQLGSVTKLIKALWGASYSQDQMAVVLYRANSFLVRYPVPNVKEELKEIYDSANREWTPVPETTANDLWSIATLEFLNKVEKNHPTANLYRVYGLLDRAGLKNRSLSEALWLVQKSGLSESQQNVLIATFAAIEKSNFSYEDNWEQAKSFCQEYSYDEANIQKAIEKISEFYGWLKSYGGANLEEKKALNKALEYVKQKVSSVKFDLLKIQFKWLNAYSGANISNKETALIEAESLVFSGVSEAQLKMLPQVLAWLNSYSGANVSNKAEAYTKMKMFVVTNSMSASQFDLLKESFQWLNIYNGAYISDKIEALNKADTYVFTKKMDATIFARLQKSFDTFHRTSRDKVTALNQAEIEVFGI